MTKSSVSSAVAPVYNKPTFRSEMVTQCLMWEMVEINSSKNDWFKIETLDGYHGWIHSFYLSEIDCSNENHLVVYDRFLPLYSDSSLDSDIISMLSFGTKVPLFSEEESGFFRVPFFANNYCYIVNNRTESFKSRDTIIDLSKTLLGVPYLWGGKSSFGFDCSGFVQLLFNVLNIFLPRDSSNQYMVSGLKNISLQESMPGDLIYFFEGDCVNHVGIIVDDNQFIHCSGQVKLESVVEGSLLFNPKLANLNFIVKSIEGLL